MSIQKVTRTNRDGKKVTRWRAFLPPDSEGKRKSKMFATKAKATLWKAEQLAERGRETTGIPQLDTPLTFRGLYDLWFEHHVAKLAVSTQQRYRELVSYMLPMLGDSVACELSPRDVGLWFRQLSTEELSPKTINMTLTTLKTLFNWGVKTHRLTFNPATAVTPLPIHESDDFDFWDAQEVERFLSCVEEDPYFVFYVTAINTGMRLNELVGLLKSAVDLRRRVIRVQRTWCNKEKRLKDTTKGKKRRSLPISDTLLPLLREQILRSPGDFVFTNPSGERIDSVHFTQNVFRPTCRKLEIRELRFHDLRHTFASHFVMNGGDLYVLQKLLGHHSITVTEMYAHLAPDYLHEAAGVVSFGAPQRGGVTQLKKG
jgi:integrase